MEIETRIERVETNNESQKIDNESLKIDNESQKIDNESQKIAERNFHNIVHIQAEDYHELPWTKEVYDNRIFNFTGLVVSVNNNLFIVTRRKTIVYCRKIVGTINYHSPMKTMNYDLEVYVNSIEWDLCILVSTGKDYFDPNLSHSDRLDVKNEFFCSDQIKLTDSAENSMIYTAISDHNKIKIHRGHFDQYVYNNQRRYLPEIVEFLGTFESIPPESCLGIPVFNNQCQLIGIINHWNNISKKQYCIIPGFIIYSFIEEVSNMLGYFSGIHHFPIEWDVIKDDELSLTVRSKDKFFMKVNKNFHFKGKDDNGIVDQPLKRDDVLISINGYPIEFFQEKETKEPHVYDLKFDIYLPFGVFCQIHGLGGKPLTLLLERKGKIIERMFYPENLTQKELLPFTNLPTTRPHLYDFKTYVKYRSWIFMLISYELMEILNERGIYLSTGLSSELTLISDAPNNIMLRNNIVKFIKESSRNMLQYQLDSFIVKSVDENSINSPEDLTKISTDQQHNFVLANISGERERLSEVYY